MARPPAGSLRPVPGSMPNDALTEVAVDYGRIVYLFTLDPP